jgi:hypothetical protein
MIARQLTQAPGCSVRSACEVLSLSSSSYYYRASRQSRRQLATDLVQEAGQHPTY